MHPLQTAWERLKRDVEAACDQQAQSAKRNLAAQLNRSFRRLSQYKNEDEWVSTLLDATQPFAGELAIFQVQGSTLKLMADRGLALEQGSTMPTPPALANAVETKDPILALRSASEVGQQLSSPGARARVVPIANGERVAALFFAPESNDTDPEALELIAGMASAVLERRRNTNLLPQIGASPEPAIAGAPSLPSARPESASPKRELPAWGQLNAQEQTLHLRAQRFARVAVAEAQLARPEACAAGRDARNLYLLLKPEIEKSRAGFRQQFMTVPSMVDYLHLELVRVLADNDESLMGAEYPGPML